MRQINKIIVHCTATPEGRAHTVADVTGWHKERGFNTIGYHWLIGINGELWKGRSEDVIGAHTVGSNHDSIGVSYVGGMTKDMKQAKDTRTEAQKVTLLKLLTNLKKTYPGARIYGHRDFSKKDCPSFNAKKEYANL